MLVELAKLESNEGKFAHDYEPGELTLDEERVELAEPPRIAGRIQREKARVTVDGALSAVTRIECDRCLQPIILPVNTEFRVEFVTPDVYQTEEAAELEAEDLALSVFNGEIIDVDELVREEVLLAVPIQALCRENCKGLCPVCGVNKNQTECHCAVGEVDPRWSGLRELKNGKS
ncbi:MAG: DUF177 domain-containing protein [Acidobacteriota bacterium]